MRCETDVRRKLARIFGPSLTWVEQAAGGTVGGADVMLPMANGFSLPVELKFWESNRSDTLLKVKIRPAQFAYHSSRAAFGVKSAFVVGAVVLDGALVAFPGSLCSQLKGWIDPVVWGMVLLPSSKEAIQRLFAYDSVFWKKDQTK